MCGPRVEGHTDSVQTVAWESSESVWTGSFDHTLKCWDAESAQLRQSFDTPKVGWCRLHPCSPRLVSALETTI